MPKTNLQNVISLGDPLLQYQFDLVIPNIPGGGDSETLKYRTMSASIPGRDIEQADLDLHGVKVVHAGRVLYTHTLPVTIKEFRDLAGYQALYGWSAMTRNKDSNGALAEEYKVPYYDLELYDAAGQTAIQTFRCYEGWIKDFPDVAMDGSGSAPVDVSFNLMYDYWLPVAGAFGPAPDSPAG